MPILWYCLSWHTAHVNKASLDCFPSWESWYNTAGEHNSQRLPFGNSMMLKDRSLKFVHWILRGQQGDMWSHLGITLGSLGQDKRLIIFHTWPNIPGVRTCQFALLYTANSNDPFLYPLSGITLTCEANKLTWVTDPRIMNNSYRVLISDSGVPPTEKHNFISIKNTREDLFIGLSICAVSHPSTLCALR